MGLRKGQEDCSPAEAEPRLVGPGLVQLAVVRPGRNAKLLEPCRGRRLRKEEQLVVNYFPFAPLLPPSVFSPLPFSWPSSQASSFASLSSSSRRSRHCLRQSQDCCLSRHLRTRPSSASSPPSSSRRRQLASSPSLAFWCRDRKRRLRQTDLCCCSQVYRCPDCQIRHICFQMPVLLKKMCRLHSNAWPTKYFPEFH